MYKSVFGSKSKSVQETLAKDETQFSHEIRNLDDADFEDELRSLAVSTGLNESNDAEFEDELRSLAQSIGREEETVVESIETRKGIELRSTDDPVLLAELDVLVQGPYNQEKTKAVQSLSGKSNHVAEDCKPCGTVAEAKDMVRLLKEQGRFLF